MFSSPPGAYLISMREELEEDHRAVEFSSPPGAYLISIFYDCVVIVKFFDVFVPYRGISNLNPVFYIALEPRLPNMVCGGNRKPCTTSLYNHLLLSAIPYFQGIGAK